MKKSKVAIIGAGPAGMSCALYLLRAKKEVVIFEKNAPGGLLNKITKIENYPGYIEDNPSTLAFRMYSSLENLKVNIITSEVLSLEEENESYVVKTKDENYKFDYIVLATGRKLKKFSIPNNIKNGISYCATCDGILYKNKDVIVLGNDNEAVSSALYLSGIVNKIYMLNDKDEFDSMDKDKLSKHENIELIYNSRIKKILSDNDKVVGVILNDNRKLDINCIFVFLGQELNEIYYDKLNLISNKYGIVVDNNMKTSKEKVYAIGDIISKDLYQVITAASEGAIAASNIIKEIQKV